MIVVRPGVVEATKRLVEEVIVEPQEWTREFVQLQDGICIPGRTRVQP